ncbi:NUCLEAR PORE COMPLEX PROTEIN NUP93 NUCLEOPORIN NUP93 DEAD EYE PROTEIN [Salix koriyanagi]|uniref:Nuclear pore protein n=1 Tax=Salix koriyanagi TaxID=2511006 RepID=A0A9Q1AB05_9ROSI|nr:NUCLEAR PORE COMPLEX PROTEIN NUP93 NUCLEOPORIN NUP93 DEAD EYE PROTEIN [Salix koriyanagi]
MDGGVLEEDWQKERRDFLQSLSRISSLPKTNIVDTSTGVTRQISSLASSPHASSGSSGFEIVPLANKSFVEKKASAYAEVVKNLNCAREHGSQFKPATAFKGAYESLGVGVLGGKSVNMQKIWHLVQTLVGENTTMRQSISRKMSLVIGARHHLEWGHEKYIMDTIQNHPAQAALGGAVGNLQRVRAFLRIRLRDYGVLDFDAGDTHRQPPVDTTWQQIYFCLRTGYYEEARTVSLSSRASLQFAPMLMEWINSGGMVPVDIAAAASEECEKMLRMGDRVGRAAYDKKKLLLYAVVSGCRRQIDRLLRDHPTLFSTIEDFLWFKLSAVRDYPAGTSTMVLNESLIPYSVEDLQAYLNKFEPSYYTKNGKRPSRIPLYHGILTEGAGAGPKLGVMDAYAEASSIIRQYGSAYLHHGNISMALEYYAQAAATVGGGEISWTGRGNIDQQRQRSLMLKQLLTELLLRDGGIYLLLGSRGAGEEGELARFFIDFKERQQYLLEVAHRCQEAGLDEKSIEIQKRVGAFSMALDTINKSLSEAICALSRGRLDGESQTAGLINSGNEILETFKYYPDFSFQERDLVLEQETVLRQLEAILSVHKMARLGHFLDALRELAKLPFLPLDPRVPDITVDALRNLSPRVQDCVPDLLKVALTCLDNVTDSDGSLRAMRAKLWSPSHHLMNRLLGVCEVNKPWWFEMLWRGDPLVDQSVIDAVFQVCFSIDGCFRCISLRAAEAARRR